MKTTENWTEPGAHPVGSGVYRIPLPMPQDGLRAVNVYLLEAQDELVLIDGGWALEASRRQLEASLRAIGHRLRDVGRFLVTHAHRDHYTQAVALRREFGASVSLGRGEEPSLRFIREATSTSRAPQLARLVEAGAERLADAWARMLRDGARDLSNWEYPDAWLDETMIPVGDRQVEAIATPGHTRGHFVFADLTDGILFAGDHVLPHITPSIGFEAVPTPSALGDYLRSLAKMRSLPDLRLLPAHGPVTSSTHQRVDELLAHHEERLAACVIAVSNGCGSAYEVAQDLGWTRHQRPFTELDAFNAVLATLETLAHLELLTSQGRLVRQPGDAPARFRCAVRPAGPRPR